ncbi:MAG: DUF4416 family protein [Desulfonatronovibrio sp.]
MSSPSIPKPGKLFLSILSSRWELFRPDLLDSLEQKFGRADYLTNMIPFTETSYYNRELGTPVSRRLLTFTPLVELDSLANLKLITNSLEESFRKAGNRIFNLDPGLLTLERLVLATGKNFTHRVYLSRGIWADLTLIFQRGDWQNLDWTFPDYSSEKIKTHLRTIRSRYHKQISVNHSEKPSQDNIL